MVTVAPAILLSAALLLALVLNLAIKPAFSGKLTTAFLLVSALGGLIFYGAGYMELTGDLVQTVVRTPLSVMRMFLGVNEMSSIAGSRLVSIPVGVILFWLAHLLAFASVASAALNTLGAAAMRHLRFLLSRRGDLTLIYGINENSIALGKECLAAGGSSVVFITESAPASLIAELNGAGMSVLEGIAAAACDGRTMRHLHLRRRTLTVYALNAAEDKDLYFALHLRDALEKLGIPAERTRVTLPGAEDIIASMLQVSEEKYGFGYVHVFDASMLTARALIRLCPPWEFVRFGADGRAREDFECVIVGFGSQGQAVLKQLVMNGQFAGAQFHAAVFSTGFSKEVGYLKADAPALFANYDIRSFEADARSSEFYEYIGERLSTLKLIAVCTGDAKINRELSDNLMLFLKRRRAENICVVRCGENAARYQERVGSPILSENI